LGDGAREGAKLAFGSYLNTVYRPEKADVSLLDSDFLGSGPGHIRYAREFSRLRKLNGPNDTMNRLYVVEPTPSVTGATADHRLPCGLPEVELFTRALAAKLGSAAPPAVPPDAEKWLDAVGKDLQAHKGASLVVAGETAARGSSRTSTRHHATLGNVGTTLYYTQPVEAHPGESPRMLRERRRYRRRQSRDAADFGRQSGLPAPHDFDFLQNKIRFGSEQQESQNTIHVSSHLTRLRTLRLATSPIDYLETWATLALSTVLSVIQPLIAPLYPHIPRAKHLQLSATNQESRITTCYATNLRPRIPRRFRKFWQETLNDGLVAGSRLRCQPRS